MLCSSFVLDSVPDQVCIASDGEPMKILMGVSSKPSWETFEIDVLCVKNVLQIWHLK
jgi:hypothetical protein